jgi:hypothetical protein
MFFAKSSPLQYSIKKRLLAFALALLLVTPLERAAAAPQPQQSQASSAAASQPAQPPADQTASAAVPGQAQQPGAPAPAVGTAAAPYEKTTGITGTRPAGAVIAPAKQRRVRSILIKIGIVAGAGAAVAAVALLSHASPSQPH